MSLQLFDAQLKAVVGARRLSGSKVAALTTLALSSMQSDTQLLSLMLRTHKALPPASKVPSLYVFDAVARAAHRTAAKHALVANLASPTGNAASFLLRLQGILDSLVDDMLAHGPEAKEKTRKVLDIWAKEGTFPPHSLAPLVAKLDPPTTPPPPPYSPTRPPCDLPPDPSPREWRERRSVDRRSRSPRDRNRRTRAPEPGKDEFGRDLRDPLDFTDPAAWARLAGVWQHSHGRPPTQEDMLLFVSSQSTARPSGLRGRRGAYSGPTDHSDHAPNAPPASHPPPGELSTTHPPPGSGSMKKVDGKWVWSRN
ncbi:Rpb7-binding protein seb1 [Ceratobasidium theobromae]|uniref:Rpb7-binding protein seb1 n=1 Tax=Ceratobasidium theobromae TaxID=1582974 RepID=A0A5N5QMR2_9AGAM|nr:Rpb7-binding protein seb1 [Ceratobasidium theobromae]